MRTLRHKKNDLWTRRVPLVLFSFALLAALVNSIAIPAAANGVAIVSISPAAQNINIGGTAVVDVFVASVSNLYGAEVHLTFDPTLLGVQDADLATSGIQIVPGPMLTGGTYSVATNLANNTIGNIDFAISQVNPTLPVSGSGVLATIRFTGLAPGTSAVHFVTTGLLPNHLSDRDGFEIPATSQDGSITVLAPPAPSATAPATAPATPRATPPAEVPEADTLMLFGTGGCGLMSYLLLQWRRRRPK